MYQLLSGLRVVEGASFIAGPLCGLHLLQMGAEVIRFDMIGGGPDFGRWPRAPGNGPSLYWEGLNKGKKSVAIDLSRPAGRELAVAIATAPGEQGGLFITNYPVTGFLAHDRLAARRPDMITVRVMGWADGRSAVDYTVNSALGVPLMTGPESLGAEPVNHVLPAWDIAAGTYAAFALLAALRQRGLSGGGAEVLVPLGDIAMATMGHLGQIAEVAISGHDRPRMGNDLFGAFGRDFATRDGRRIMVVALTRRQWTDLVDSLGLGEAVRRLEVELGVDLAADEGVRFEHRHRLNPLVAAAVSRRSLDELVAAFAGTGVCWGPYNRLSDAIDDPQLISADNPLFASVAHVSGYSYPTPGAAATIPGARRDLPGRAPLLGEHTDEVLASLLALPDHEIARLHDAGVVAGPADRNA
jgi:2-methylfumaryl-CoA isomerase